MNAVSNQKICRAEGGVFRNIGFYFKVTFSLAKPVEMQLHVPTDFGWGGVSAMDEQTMVAVN